MSTDRYVSPLSERYASKEMQYIFSPDMKFRTWRRLWIALAETEKELGLNITQEQIDELKAHKDDINYDVAKERERQVRHDVMSHVYAYGVQCPKAKGIIHLGATSCYVGDNTDIIVMAEALKLVQKKLVNVIAELSKFADKYKEQPTLAFTHFQPAQPTTVGKRATLWTQEFLMDLEDLEYVMGTLKLLGSKGTTGTQASFLELFEGDQETIDKIDPMIAEKMGFKNCYPVSGQTYSRKVDTRGTARIRMKQGVSMLASLFSKPQSSLSVQAKRLVAMRFLIYTGFQTSYFIGVIGTLTYADDASVVATSLAVLFMNVFVILGSFAGGAALDAWGPRRHFLLSIIGALATGTAIIAFGSATGVVLLGAVFLGFVMGFAQPIATSYPAYLTDDPVELKDINSAIAMFSNVSIIVGPTLGGFVAAAASSRAVFVLMMLFTVLAFVVGWGFRPQTSHVAGDADADSAEEGERAGQSSNPSTSARATFAASIKTVFTNSVLALLFCIIFLSNFGYGAFDPLESFFYRDVLRVGVEWMGWLSSASGVGAVLGAVLALRLPPHLVNLKTLLVALMSVGLGSLLYVGTPYVGVALVGQVALGIAWGVVNPLHNTIVQTTAPLEQLGRVNSVMGFGNMFAGVAPLAIAPWLAATFGVQQTLIGAGMVVTAVPAALLLFGRRHFDRAARQ